MRRRKSLQLSNLVVYTSATFCFNSVVPDKFIGLIQISQVRGFSLSTKPLNNFSPNELFHYGTKGFLA